MTAPRDARSRDSLVQHVVFAMLGGVIALFGCFPILYIYAHAQMIDPTIVGWDRWKIVFETMFLTSAVVAVLFGVTVLGVGVAITVCSMGAALGFRVRGATTTNLLVLAVTILLFAALLAYFA